jgi:molybdopterin-guanine dinucleotide biosynthesis protein MobB
MIPAVSFIGHHDSGKTRLLTRLIPYLAGRGFRIGAVKHAPHLDAPADPGTDSGALVAAGADPALLLAGSYAVLTWRRTAEERIIETQLERLFPDCDLVLVEGMKHGPLPKIEVYRREQEIAREPLAGEIDVLAVITDDRIAVPDGTVILSPSNLSALADLLESRLL